MPKSLIIVILIFGFVVGRMSAQRSEQKETIKKSLQLEKIINEIHEAQASIEKIDAIAALSKTEEYYYPSGKLSKKVTTNTHLETTSTNEVKTQTNSITKTNKVTQEEVKTIVKLSPKNWMVGVQLSTEDARKLYFKSPEVTLGYRIVGNVYATASSDVAFKNPKIGVTLTF